LLAAWSPLRVTTKRGSNARLASKNTNRGVTLQNVTREPLTYSVGVRVLVTTTQQSTVASVVPTEQRNIYLGDIVRSDQLWGDIMMDDEYDSSNRPSYKKYKLEKITSDVHEVEIVLNTQREEDHATWVARIEKEYDEHVERISNQYKIDPVIVKTIIEHYEEKFMSPEDWWNDKWNSFRTIYGVKTMNTAIEAACIILGEVSNEDGIIKHLVNKINAICKKTDSCTNPNCTFVHPWDSGYKRVLINQVGKLVKDDPELHNGEPRLMVSMRFPCKHQNCTAHRFGLCNYSHCENERVQADDMSTREETFINRRNKMRLNLEVFTGKRKVYAETGVMIGNTTTTSSRSDNDQTQYERALNKWFPVVNKPVDNEIKPIDEEKLKAIEKVGWDEMSISEYEALYGKFPVGHPYRIRK
jgi:hypothetical protein